MSVDKRTVIHKGNRYVAGIKNSMCNEDLERLYSIVMKEFDDWENDYISRTDVIKKSPKFFTRAVLRRYELAGNLKKMYLGKGRVIYFLEDIKRLVRDMIFGGSSVMDTLQDKPSQEEPANV